MKTSILTLLFLLYSAISFSQISCTPIKNYSGEITYYKYSDGYAVPRDEYIESDRIINQVMSTYQSGDFEAVLNSLKKALMLNKHNNEALFFMGLSKMQSNKYVESLECFDKCTKINQDSAKYWYHKGKVQVLLGTETDSSYYYDLSIASFSTSIKINAQNTIYWIERANSRALIKDYHGALNDLRTVATLKPSDDSTWDLIGNIYNDLGTETDSIQYFDMAIVAFTKALEISPENSNYLTSRAMSKYNKKEMSGAIKDCKKASSIDKENSNCWYILSLIKYGSGDKINALKYLNSAIKIEHTNSHYLLHRSKIKIELNDRKGALSDLDAVIGYNPKCVECYFERAVLRSEHPFFDFPGTVTDYYQVIELSRDDDNFSWMAKMNLRNYVNWLSGVHLFTIAISTYDDSKTFENIDYSVRDVVEFEQIFASKNLIKKKYTLLNSQATKSNILQELKKVSRIGFLFENEYGATDNELSGVGIFYFSGHGLTINGRPGICPYDYKSESDIIYLDTIQKYLEESNNMGIVCFIESCKNEKTHSLTMGNESKNRVENAPNSDIILFFSTEEGKISYGDNSGGYFNRSVIDGLYNGRADSNMDTYITIDELYEFVKKSVTDKSSGVQIPQLKLHDNQKNKIFFRSIKK
jgi:tetratricopeptide (TPR) repeat protein